MLTLVLALAPLVGGARVIAQDSVIEAPLSEHEFQARLIRTAELIHDESNPVWREQGFTHLYALASRVHAEGSIERLDVLSELAEATEEHLRDALKAFQTDLSPEGISDWEWVSNHLIAAQTEVWRENFELVGLCLSNADSRMTEDPSFRYHSALFWCRFELSRARFAAAEIHLARAEELACGVDWGDDADAAWASLAQLYYKLGRFSECRRLWPICLEIALEQEDWDTAKLALIDRATYRLLVEDWEGAIEDAKFTLEIIEGQPSAEAQSSLVEAHILLGQALTRLEEYEQAESHYRLVIERVVASPSTVAIAHAGLGDIAYWRGEYELALSEIQVALEAARDLDLIDQVLFDLQLLAKTRLALGDSRMARDAMEEALHHLESEQLQQVAIKEAARIRARFSDWSKIAQDLIAAESRKSATDLERESLAREGMKLAAMWSGRSLTDALITSSGTPSAIRSIRSTEEVRRALPRGSYLLQYTNGEKNLYAYTLSVEGTSLVDLGPHAEIERGCEIFVERVLESASSKRAMTVATAGSNLYDMVFAPLEDRIPADTSRLYIVATPALSAIPFDALVTEAPTAETTSFEAVPFLLDRFTVIHLPTAQLLPLLAERPPRSRPGRALLIGDPVFPSESETTESARSVSALLRYSRLLGSRDEAIEAAMFHLGEDEIDASSFGAYRRLLGSQERDIEAHLSDRTHVYLGAKATPDLLTSKADEIEHLLIATHSHEVPGEPDSVALLLSPGTSGDRLLDLEEIRALDLDAQLVVLSGCKTDFGPLLRGDGIQSIANSFLEAGAREVVASMTSVNDGAARDLIQELYKQRAQGLSTAKALRQAKVKIRSRTRVDRGVGREESDRPSELPLGHPRRWASFVYCGR